MNKLVRISATVASSLALVAGFSGVAGAASMNDTGRDSHNTIKSVKVVKTDVDNHTNLSLRNDSHQEAFTGDANVQGNDDVAGVSTGGAMNDNSTDADVSVASTTSTPSTDFMSGGSDMSDASMTDTGRNSTNEIKSVQVVKTNVDNDTNVCLTNTSTQNAGSGDANVKNNDDVGNVTTGNASNTNNTTLSLSVSNTTN